MTRRFLIDGHNLLHVWGASKRKELPDHGALRERLVNELEEFSAWDGAFVSVVFDAPHRSPRAVVGTSTAHLRVIFAQGRHSADEVIERMVRDPQEARTGLTVVTDDRMVGLVVGGAGVAVMGNRMFLTLMADAQRDLRGRLSEA